MYIGDIIPFPYPKIEIDHSKCTTPYDCKKCLLICPQVVFRAEAIKADRGVETNPKEPGAWVLDPYYRDKCIVCLDCIKVCPIDAIKIIHDSQEYTKASV